MKYQYQSIKKNGVKRWGLYVVRKGTIYTAHIYVHMYMYNLRQVHTTVHAGI